MKAKLLSLLVACGALAGLSASDPALAQKSGGVLRMPLGTSIASVSIHEESTIVVLGPMMGVFNNLVMFDQHVPQNTLSSIVPDLASSCDEPNDIASTALYLASDESRMVTGQVLPVDSGVTIS